MTADALAATSALEPLLAVTMSALDEGERNRGGPVPAGPPGAVAAAVAAALGDATLPEVGVGPEQALRDLVRVLAAGSADPRDVRCAAHLHCPPLAVAVAADLAVSALNPSVDSWDQAPSGVAFEHQVVAELACLAGLPPTAGGSITSGASESNFLGVLLGREHLGADVAVVCSEASHFSVAQAARVLGLGTEAVRTVRVDDTDRMDVADLDAVLAHLHPRRAVVVATAGTTDLGTVDPLPAVAVVAARRGAWFHVDAAYGGGALLSDRLRPLLDGLQLADSIALDLHKLGWQPVPAGVFLTRDTALLDPLHRRADYLNPADDEAAGYTGRLGHSIRTTRRPDAFPIAVTMRALGRHGLGALVDRCHDLARHAADRVRGDERLELAAEPVLTTVVFRVAADDEVNSGLRRRLLVDGAAVVGRTTRHGRTWLKLTLLNPHATPADVDALLDLVLGAADAERAATVPA